MADIRLGSGNDTYLQPEADKNLWNNVFGEDGNDIIKMYQGTGIGGKGNDTFEKIIDPLNLNREVGVAYWDSPAGIFANLAAGWIDDGWGTRDAVVGISKVHGSGQNDRFLGDGNDNYFHPNGGRDTLDGGGGVDGFDVREIPPVSGGGNWIPATLQDVDITAAVDGLAATVVVRRYPQITYSTTNMEYITFINDSNRYLLADYITHQSMAEQAIAAGGTLRWNASGAIGTAVNLTYSFIANAPSSGVGANGFRAFTPAEQQLVRELLAKTALIAGLTFNEVTEAGATVGQLRFGVSQQLSTKGQAFLPGQSGDQAGDVWMDVESMISLAVGTEGYQALLHETGHALGLRHPRNVDPGDAWGVQLRAQDDRISLSVMSSGTSSDGLFRADWGVLDVLALRHLYGSRSMNASDTMYALGARESAAQTTVVDDGGIDTLDASRLASGVNLDLVPGHLSSAGITGAGYAGVDNLGLPSTSLIENAVGSAFDDVLLGNTLANVLTGGLGNDWIDGGEGNDSSTFSGLRSDYELSNAFGKVFVRARDGVSGYDTLIGIERLNFADQSIALSAKVVSSDSNFSIDEDTVLTTALPEPSDTARSSVSYRLVGTPAHGSASVSADGQLRYTPAANFWGTDAVAYEIVGAAGSNRYLSFVQMLPVNDGAPQSQSATLLMPGGHLVESQLPAAIDVDGDTISYGLRTAPKNGNAIVASSGSFSYAANAGYNGSDSLSFSVSDGVSGSNVYTLTLNVVPVATVINGSAGADVMQPGANADAYLGRAGNDRISAGNGNDLIDGGAGVDTVVYLNARSSYNLLKTDFGWTVQDNANVEGRDSLAGVERLAFGNTHVALDLDGNAGAVAQIIRALIGKSFLGNKDFVGIGLQLFDGGMSYADVVKLAVGTDLFAQLAGGRSNTAFVNFVYKNVIGVAPSAAELVEYTGLLNAGVFTQDSLGLLAAQVSFNTTSVELVGLAATGMEFNLQGS